MKSLPLLLALSLGVFAAARAQQFHWTPVYQPDSDTTLYDVYVIDAINAIAVGDTGVMKRTRDGGSSWNLVPSGTKKRLYRIRFMNATDGYIVGGEIGGSESLLLRSTDGGETWSEIDTKGNKTLFDVWFHNRDTGIVVGQAGVMRATVDGGNNWISINAGFSQNNIYSIDFPTRNIGYICGNVGNVAKSTNGGAGWRGQNSGNIASLFSLSFADANNGTIAGDGGVILHTSNGGSKWETQYAEFPISSSLLRVTHLDLNTAYICGWFGIIIGTTDAGVTWRMQEWSGTEILQSLHFADRRNGYAVGWNSTILKTLSGGGLVSIEPSPIPVAATIIKGYPNPVSVSSKRRFNVEFTLPTSGAAKLSLIDALGRNRHTVLNRHLDPGAHVHSFDVSSLPPGLYYLHMTGGFSAAALPLVVVK